MSDDVIIPPRAPHGYAEIVAYFGDPKPTKASSGEWRVDEKWERDNCVRFEHAMLPTAPCPHCRTAQPGHLFVHRLIVDPLKFVLDGWAELQRGGNAYPLEHCACFAPRAQRGSNGLVPSLHTWAAAVDFNPCTNRLITNILPDDPRRTTIPLVIGGEVWRDLPAEHLYLIKSAGFMSGCEFEHRFDPMHAQLATGL